MVAQNSYFWPEIGAHSATFIFEFIVYTKRLERTRSKDFQSTSQTIYTIYPKQCMQEDVTCAKNALKDMKFIKRTRPSLENKKVSSAYDCKAERKHTTIQHSKIPFIRCLLDKFIHSCSHTECFTQFLCDHRQSSVSLAWLIG